MTRPAMGERGSAMIEVVALGMVAAVVVLQITMAAGRLQAAGEEATEVAQTAAAWAARHGDAAMAAAMARDLLPGSEVTAAREGSAITVTVRTRVSVVGPPGAAVTHVVTGRASARVSPYRSNNGG